MTIDKEERESLHLALDYLLNERTHLEKFMEALPEGASYMHAYYWPRRELFQQAAIFLRRVLGPKLHRDALHVLFDAELVEGSQSSDVPMLLANSLSLLLPLFMESERGDEMYSNENIEKIVSDLRGIFAGDEPRFFTIRKKPQGSPKRPYRIAKLRLAALDWEKYLAVVEVPIHERRSIVSRAFRTDWQAISKWAKPLDNRWGMESRPPDNAEHAKARYLDDPAEVLEAIQRDGDAYWLEKRTKYVGKET